MPRVKKLMYTGPSVGLATIQWAVTRCYSREPPKGYTDDSRAQMNENSSGLCGESGNYVTFRRCQEDVYPRSRCGLPLSRLKSWNL